VGSTKPLHKILNSLEAHYGKQSPPKVRDPLGMILWENVAYLVSDAHRESAFNALKERIGLVPEKILAAPAETLWEIADLGGMFSGGRVEKLLKVAKIALDSFNGDLDSILKLPLTKAKRGLQKFPGIGQPGAEKILQFSRTFPILALESNGLRVLVRLGFSEAKKNYSGTYRAMQDALRPQIKEDYDWLICAYQLLRHHGQQLCKNSKPFCDLCPVSRNCFYFQKA
jgi:endonuclease-3